MKQILIILSLFASVTTFAQSPRIKLNQITKDTVKGSVLISSPSDSGMVYSRDFYVAYGADTVLILYGDTLAATSGIISSVLSDGVTITGNGTSGNELKVDTLLIATIKALNDSLSTISASTTPDGVTITGDGSVGNPLKVDTLLISTVKGLNDTLTNRGYLSVAQLTDTLDANTRGFLTSEVDGSITNELQTISTSGAAGNITLSDGGGTLNLNVDDADASATNEGSLTVGAGTASTSVISSNTSGSTDVTLTAGTNITLSETGNNITIAASGGGTTYNNISETADTVFIDKYLNVDTSTIYVDATNNRVGIGTSSPDALLTLNGGTLKAVSNGDKFAFYEDDVAESDAYFKVTNAAGGANLFLPVFNLKSNNTGIYYGNGMIFDVTSDTATAGPIVEFMARANGGTVTNRSLFRFANYFSGTNGSILEVKANGNVGIGTSSPQAPLSVAGSIHLLDVNQTSFADNNFYVYNDSDAGSTSGATNAEFSFFVAKDGSTNSGHGPNFIMRGNDYTRNANERGAMFFSAGNPASPTGNDGMIQFTSQANEIKFRTGASPVDRIIIENDGDVFMPNVYSDLISGTTRDLYIKDDGQLGYISSTAKSKTNIYDLNNVDFIYNLNPVSFNYRKQNDNGEFTDEFYDKTSYGLIAEEVVNVADYMVYYDKLEDGGFIPVGVNYSELITPMLKAIQQQKDEIHQLKTLITDLTNRIQILENK